MAGVASKHLCLLVNVSLKGVAGLFLAPVQAGIKSSVRGEKGERTSHASEGYHACRARAAADQSNPLVAIPVHEESRRSGHGSKGREVGSTLSLSPVGAQSVRRDATRREVAPVQSWAVIKKTTLQRC